MNEPIEISTEARAAALRESGGYKGHNHACGYYVQQAINARVHELEARLAEADRERERHCEKST